jgi:hypothetical protein
MEGAFCLAAPWWSKLGTAVVMPCRRQNNNQKDYARALQATRRQLFLSCRECLVSDQLAMALVFLCSGLRWVDLADWPG